MEGRDKIISFYRGLSYSLVSRIKNLRHFPHQFPDRNHRFLGQSLGSRCSDPFNESDTESKT